MSVDMKRAQEYIGKKVLHDGVVMEIVDFYITGDERSDWPVFILKAYQGVHVYQEEVHGWSLNIVRE